MRPTSILPANKSASRARCCSGVMLVSRAIPNALPRNVETKEAAGVAAPVSDGCGRVLAGGLRVCGAIAAACTGGGAGALTSTGGGAGLGDTAATFSTGVPGGTTGTTRVVVTWSRVVVIV